MYRKTWCDLLHFGLEGRKLHSLTNRPADHRLLISKVIARSRLLIIDVLTWHKAFSQIKFVLSNNARGLNFSSNLIL